MNYKISFQERARLGMEMLSKKSPVTLEKAKAQAERLRQARIKSEETTLLKQYCNQNNFWVTTIDISTFISSGAEQRVYLFNKYKVIKLNDSIYYEVWLDYFNNLLLNNYFFS